jgi:hypothetical protein
MVPLVPGSAGAGVVAGGVDCVVVLSVPPVPLSLQAATPSSAIAATDAKMSFFITSLLGFQAIVGAVGRRTRRLNDQMRIPLLHIAFLIVTACQAG